MSSLDPARIHSWHAHVCNDATEQEAVRELKLTVGRVSLLIRRQQGGQRLKPG